MSEKDKFFEGSEFTGERREFEKGLEGPPDRPRSGGQHGGPYVPAHKLERTLEPSLNELANLRQRKNKRQLACEQLLQGYADMGLTVSMLKSDVAKYFPERLREALNKLLELDLSSVASTDKFFTSSQFKSLRGLGKPRTSVHRLLAAFFPDQIAPPVPNQLESETTNQAEVKRIPEPIERADYLIRSEIPEQVKEIAKRPIGNMAVGELKECLDEAKREYEFLIGHPKLDPSILARNAFALLALEQNIREITNHDKQA